MNPSSQERSNSSPIRAGQRGGRNGFADSADVEIGNETGGIAESIPDDSQK